MYIIPTSFNPEQPYYKQTTTIEGKEYSLDFRYSTREACWYLSIATTSGTPLATGVKIVPNINLLRRFTRERLPRGELRAIARGQDGTIPGLEDLGEARRVELVYFESKEI